MGCKSCRSQRVQESTVVLRIQNSIKNDDPVSLMSLIRLYCHEEKLSLEDSLNQMTLPLDNALLNFLGYAIWVGSEKCYLCLVHKLKASITVTEEIFKKQKVSVISYICEKGYIDILKHYIVAYISSLKKYEDEEEGDDKTYWLSFSTSNQYGGNSKIYTPVQLACLMGHVNIVYYLHTYFAEHIPPYTLNVHYINEVNGENCALIAIKACNFVMMKMLFEMSYADFHIKNKNGEGALQILAIASKSNSCIQYLECFMYLVEVIQVDVTYMHEETLLLLDNSIIIRYMEDKLKKSGISIKKADLEETCSHDDSKDMNINYKAYRDIKSSSDVSDILKSSVHTNFAGSIKL